MGVFSTTLKGGLDEEQGEDERWGVLWTLAMATMAVRVSSGDKGDGDAGAGDAVVAFNLRLRVMLRSRQWDRRTEGGEERERRTSFTSHRPRKKKKKSAVTTRFHFFFILQLAYPHYEVSC